MKSSDADARKQRLLAQEEPSRATGIADAFVIKDEGLYFLCRRDGSVPLEEGHGLGLYYRDCRFLSGSELRISGELPEPLAANDEDGFRSAFQLTNPNIAGVNRQRIGIRWRHVLDAENRALRDELTFENYDTQPHAFSASLKLDADFHDIYVIRGMVDEPPGTLRPSAWEAGELVFSYDGGDQQRRQLRVRFSETPTRMRKNEAQFDWRLAPHETRKLMISLAVSEAEASRVVPIAMEGEEGVTPSIEEWMKGFARVRSTSLWVERAVDRSLRDLRALRTTLDEHRFFAGGIPWFATLFGRDSLICALQTLAYRPEIAAETLRLLARFQGKRFDRWRDEEPGKILHELRVGELAQMGAIPYTPYYGTVDATPLFLILLGEYVRWQGDLSLFEELKEPVGSALRWMNEGGDHDQDGYLDYQGEAGQRLINQGWKDSGNAIVDSTGRRARPPIALCEVQGYVFRARRTMADLYERAGDHDMAASLRQGATAIRDRFNRDFWLEDARFYALALERGGRRVDAIASNAGQAVWSGIVQDDRVGVVVARLMAEDMFSGWGIRTLSSRERAYNPVGYHLGTVWPHDNSLIAAGFRRYGFDTEACRIFEALLDAATYFPDNRLPETFAGYARADYGSPVRYPVACHPQAWAAGAIPFLLQSLLGLCPDAFAKRLRIVRPVLPHFIDRLELERVRVGTAEVDLVFERAPGGELQVGVERLDGSLDVQVESRSST